MKKRSISLRGHRTSILLEREFWDAIERSAVARGVSLASLVASIDDDRVSRGIAGGLASALRVFALREALGLEASGARRET